MKKIALIAAIASALSVSTVAQASPFQAGYAGIEIGSNKLKLNDGDASVSGKQKANYGFIVGAGGDFGNTGLVGLVEGKLKFGGSEISGESSNFSAEMKEKYQLSVAYLQGYNIADVALPYVKIGYAYGQYDVKVSVTNAYYNVSASSTEAGHGLELGAGVKFALGEKVKLGVEYARQNLKVDSVKFNNDQINLNIAFSY